MFDEGRRGNICSDNVKTFQLNVTNHDDVESVYNTVKELIPTGSGQYKMISKKIVATFGTNFFVQVIYNNIFIEGFPIDPHSYMVSIGSGENYFLVAPNCKTNPLFFIAVNKSYN